MLNLDFWFMFLGFLLVVATIPAILNPKKLKGIFKSIFKDENHIRAISVWYLFVGPLALYSGWNAGSFWGASLILVIGFLLIIKGLLLFFATEWYQDTVLKKVLKLSDLTFQIAGSVKFIIGLLLLYYGFFFL